MRDSFENGSLSQTKVQKFVWPDFAHDDVIWKVIIKLTSGLTNYVNHDFEKFSTVS